MCSKRQEKKWNKGSGAFGSRHHSANPETRERKKPEGFPLSQSNRSGNLMQMQIKEAARFQPKQPAEFGNLGSVVLA